MGCVLFVRAQRISQERLQERLQSFAALSAMQFDGAEFETIRGRDDMRRPAFRALVAHLREIRQSVPYIRFVYILRQTDRPGMLRFVADSDSLLTREAQDENRNGTIEPNEELSLPGDPYDASAMPAMLEGFDRPSADAAVTTDQWGRWISGYAPIRRRDTGEAVALIGLDMDASDYLSISRNILSPAAFVALAIGSSLIAVGAMWSLYRRRFQESDKVDAERAGLMLLTYHQLGEPLSIFKWSLESLQDREPGQTAEQAIAVHVENLQSGIRRMDQMINDLKQAAQVQEGRVDFRPKPGGLKEVVAAVIEDFQREHPKIKQTIECAAESIVMPLDERLVAVVLTQLLANAANYSPTATRILVAVRREGREAHVSVQDFGAGIPHADQPRLFQKFMRGGNAGRIQPDGNGLGLFIAKGFVDRAGGRLWFESDEGKGSTFHFTLPIREK